MIVAWNYRYELPVYLFNNNARNTFLHIELMGYTNHKYESLSRTGLSTDFGLISRSGKILRSQVRHLTYERELHWMSSSIDISPSMQLN